MGSAIRRVLVGAVMAATLSACAESAVQVELPEEASRITLTPGSSAVLASSLTQSIGSSATWNVTTPSSGGTILLSFTARVQFSSPAGNASILEILVNGQRVTGTLVNKGASYTYQSGGTEDYYATRGLGQAHPYWGLFYSPDFVQNDLPGGTYSVVGGNAYRYVIDITPYVTAGTSNSITLTNQGGWISTLTGLTTLDIVFANVVVQA